MADAKPHTELPPLDGSADRKAYGCYAVERKYGINWNAFVYPLFQLGETQGQAVCDLATALDHLDQRERQLLQEREARIKSEAELEAAALRLEGTAKLYESYANHPRYGSDPALMLRSAVDYREAARIVRNGL